MLAAALVLCFIVYTYLAQRDKRKLAFVANITEQTEEAESINFAVHLFDDEPEEKWLEKMGKAFKMAEDRRGFNNKRMMEMIEQAQKENVLPLNKE